MSFRFSEMLSVLSLRRYYRSIKMEPNDGLD